MKTKTYKDVCALKRIDQTWEDLAKEHNIFLQYTSNLEEGDMIPSEAFYHAYAFFEE